MANNVK